MKFKSYKAARNYLINRIEKTGVDIRDINVEQLMSRLFKGSGVGGEVELELRPPSNTFPLTVEALRIPRRGTVSDKHWMVSVRRLAGYMGTYYAAEDADALAVELRDQALFARHMLEEAL